MLDNYFNDDFLTYYKNLQLLFENKQTKQNNKATQFRAVDRIHWQGGNAHLQPQNKLGYHTAAMANRWISSSFGSFMMSQHQKCLLPFCSSRQGNICWFSVGSATCGPSHDRAQDPNTPVWRTTLRNHHEILRLWPGFRNPPKVGDSILKMRGSLWSHQWNGPLQATAGILYWLNLLILIYLNRF